MNEYNNKIQDLLETTSIQVSSIHENILKLLEVQSEPPQINNSSTRVFKTTPRERINRAKRVSDGWYMYVSHDLADQMSSYSLSEIIEVSQPWCLHMINCRRKLIELGKDPKAVPWSEARTVINR